MSHQLNCMPYYFLVCNGKIEVLSIDGSVNLSFDAEDLRDENFIRKKRHCKMYTKQPQCKIKPNHIEFAKVSGNCCWQLCSRYRGGQCRDISSVGFVTGGWPIKRVVLTDCPNWFY